VARQVLQVLANQIEQIEATVTALERQLLAWHKTNPVSQRLASIPGIGRIIATAIATTVADPKVFRSGREFAAWLGLVPRQNSTGGKTRLGGITKRGNQSAAIEGDQSRALPWATKPPQRWAGIPSRAASPPRQCAPSCSPAPRLRPAAAAADAARSPKDRAWSLRESNDA
jgi:hypothetical protein